MVVEHTFVTTLPRDQALKKASDFLARGGFVAQTQTAFAMDGAEWTNLNVRRGRAGSTKYMAIPDLPQQVQVEWDRGRMSVAASISDRHSAKKRTQLLLAIVNGLEAVLVKNQSEDESLLAWIKLDSELRRSGRWYRYRRWILTGLVLALWAGIVIFYLNR